MENYKQTNKNPSEPFPFIRGKQKYRQMEFKTNRSSKPSLVSLICHGAMQPLQLPVGISTPPPRSASSSARHRRTPSAGSVTSAYRAPSGVAKDAVQVWRFCGGYSSTVSCTKNTWGKQKRYIG